MFCACLRTDFANADTNMGRLKERWVRASEQIRAEYGAARFEKEANHMSALRQVLNKDVNQVVNTMIEAVTTSDQPEHFYRVGAPFERTLFLGLVEYLPSELVDFLAGGKVFVVACAIFAFFKTRFGL
jgi:hypothetical protein